MRTMGSVSVLILACWLGAVAAQAQEDYLCVCTDDRPSDCGGNVDLGGSNDELIVYLCLVNTTGSLVTGWEAQVEVVNPGPYWHWILANGQNLGSGDDFIVDCSLVPLQPNGLDVVLLMWMELWDVDHDDTIEFYVRGVPGSTTFPGSPGYTTGTGQNVPASICGGSPYLPVFTVNGDPVNPPPPPTYDDFTVDIGVQLDDLSDVNNTAGANHLATDGYDSENDIPEPPPPPSDYVSLYFDRPEWGFPLGDRFMSDIKREYDPEAFTKTWPFTVESDRTGAAELTFETDGFGLDWGLYLHDIDEGLLHDLRLCGFSRVIDVTAGQARTFELWVGPTELMDVSPGYRTIFDGWSLVGCPLVPPAPGTVEQAILQSATGTVFVYDLDVGTGYRIMQADDPVAQGDAFWVAASESFTWTMPGGAMDMNGVAVPLNEGWTMVGYPLWAPVDLADCLVTHPVYGIQIWGVAVASGWMAGGVYGYSPLSEMYYVVDACSPWFGYWVASYADDLILHFPHPGSSGASGGGGVDPDVVWALDVSVDGRSANFSFGLHALSVDGFDARYDLPAPPGAPAANPFPTLSFDHPEWDLPTGRAFITDFRPPADPPCRWDALLTAPAPGTVSLSWDGGALPEDTDLQVYLPQQNRVVVMSMRDESSVTLDVGAEPLQVVFRSPDMSTGIADAPGRHTISCHPNPFNPTTEIELRTVAAGHIDLEIYDLRGRRVRSFTLGEQPAGTYRATWRGRDDDGREVAGGTYFAVLALDGVRTGTLAKLTLVR